jgi:hypothetical protein
MAQIADAIGEDLGAGDLEFNYVVDMSDYGTTVDFDAPDDVVDITDSYAALIES